MKFSVTNKINEGVPKGVVIQLFLSMLASIKNDENIIVLDSDKNPVTSDEYACDEHIEYLKKQIVELIIHPSKLNVKETDKLLNIIFNEIGIYAAIKAPEKIKIQEVTEKFRDNFSRVQIPYAVYEYLSCKFFKAIVKKCFEDENISLDNKTVKLKISENTVTRLINETGSNINDIVMCIKEYLLYNLLRIEAIYTKDCEIFITIKII